MEYLDRNSEEPFDSLNIKENDYILFDIKSHDSGYLYKKKDEPIGNYKILIK